MTCSLILSAVGAPLVASADEYDQKIQEQNQKIDDLNKKEASASQQLAEVRTNIATIKAEAEKLQKEQATLNSEVTKLNSEVKELTSNIEKRDKTIKAQARSVQTQGANTGYLDIVLNSDSVSDAITKVAAANELVSANNDLMEQQKSDKKAVQTKQAASEKKLDEVNKNAVTLDEKAGELQDQELTQTALVNEIAASKETETSKKSEYEAQQKAAEEKLAEQTRLAKVAAENKAAEEAAAKTAAQTSTSTSTSTSGTSSSSNSNTNNGTSNTGGNSDNNVTPTPTPTPDPIPNGSGIVSDALKYLGVPYVWGGTTPSGFDCSGLVQYVFAMNGITLPRTTTQQEFSGTVISISQLQAGDLVFFGARGSTHHVGIYIGGGQFVHAPQTGDVVKITSISAYTPDFGVRVN